MLSLLSCSRSFMPSTNIKKHFNHNYNNPNSLASKHHCLSSHPLVLLDASHILWDF